MQQLLFWTLVSVFIDIPGFRDFEGVSQTLPALIFSSKSECHAYLAEYAEPWHNIKKDQYGNLFVETGLSIEACMPIYGPATD